MASGTYDTTEKEMEAYKQRIRKEFPSYAFSRGRFASKGEDHIAVIFDEAWVFRFPRVDGYKKSFSQELRVLEALEPNVTIPIPHYEYISSQKDFGGYRMIRGEELTVERFEGVAEEARPKIAREIGDFLSAVHSLPEDLILPDNPHQSWSASDYRTRYHTVRKPTIATVLPAELLPRVDRFYDTFSALVPPFSTVLHGDLRDAHLFVDHVGRALAGVIDFGDAGLGDPASDFSFLWSYGKDFWWDAYDQYSLIKDDHFILRSKWHYARFLIDQFYYLTRDPKRTQLPWLLRELLRELDELHVRA